MADHPPILTGRPWPGFPCAEANGLPRLRYNPYALSPKQTAFLLYPGEEALFGGSGGSGKSIGLLAAALQFVDVPGYNAALFRRSLTDFTLPDGLIDVSHDWLDNTDAQWNGNKYRWTFPSGAVLQFAYLKQWGAERRYKSTQFQFVGFDEVTEFPWEEQMLYLFSRMRTGVDSAEMAAEVYGTAPDGLTLYDVPLRMRGACVDEGEVLTVDRGWVDIRDVHEGESVYSVSTDGTMEPKPVLAHHAYLNDKPMVRVEMKNLTMSMTVDHRVTHMPPNPRHPERVRYETTPYNEHEPKQMFVARAPRRSSGPGTDVDPLGWGTDVYLEYLGLYLAEGSTPPPREGNYKVLVTQCDPVGAERVCTLMERIPLRHCHCSNGDFQITNKAAWEHFSQLGKAHQKRVPRAVLRDASESQLRTLLGWMVFGDGHVRGESIQYVTVSPGLADDVAEIGVKLGYKVKVARRELADPNHNDRFVVYLTKNSLSTRVEKEGERSNVTHATWDGMVYCIEVADNHNFVLRQKGTVWISGNTNPGGPGHAWTYARYVDKENPNRQPFLPATLDDNPGINKEEYRKMLAKLPEVERQRMEEGNWDVIEVPGALWRFADYQHIDQKWVPPASDVGMRVLSIDPSITAEGDECGMIMGSITGGVVTVELDLSKQMHPDVWARLAIETMIEYGCDRVVCEDNQGGELVFSALRNAADAMGVPYPRIIKVHSSISKEARAVPVAQAYRAGKVRHSVLLRSGPLESQQTSWVPGISKESPDRIDAAVWLVRHALFGEGDDVEYHNSSARQQLSSRNQSTNAPVVHSTAGSALRKGSSRGPGRL